MAKQANRISFYAFGIEIVLGILLFLLTAAGQH